MPRREDIKKILVIGSGPIIIGQAAEFDYAGTQACQSLKEEGYEVILINSNPATIMTDKKVADKVYIEPLTIEFASRIIYKERPDAILGSLGGQTGLNLVVELDKLGILGKYGVEVLGTELEAIEKAEDRDKFRELMYEIGEPVPESVIVHTVEEAVEFAEENGYPVVVRPAFTLGGTGGGFADNREELEKVCENGLKISPAHQCLIEKSIAGFKEIEYEVMRDSKDNAIVVCNMENVDPVGVHTGDSIVVAPTQTLTDKECGIMRASALKIIRALKICGGCNVQLALDPNSFKYYVIEVNPRVSRSSALASKATGYPIAKLAAKVAVGLGLDEIVNPVTKTSYACVEPCIDYVVAKLPRFAFDKFPTADRSLGTQMKATGEVMAIGRTFDEAFLKGIRSLEMKINHLEMADLKSLSDEELEIELLKQKDDRFFIIAEMLRRKDCMEEIFQKTTIDRYFLNKIKEIVDFEKEIKGNKNHVETLKKAKKMGFSDGYISKAWGVDEKDLYDIRKANNIVPVYKMVDTCAGEFASETPYLYSTYEKENESVRSGNKKIIVLGSGPIRIGQGVEFDYATVHCIKTLKACGFEAIIINNNPETVSTDYSISDKLYFEPLTIEDVMHVIDLEKPEGVIVQFGGQTAINLADKIVDRGVKIIGTSLENIDKAEDRKEFEEMLKKLNIPQPTGDTAFKIDEAVEIANKIGYPVLVRPSYVLGGRAMEIVHNDEDLRVYMATAVKEISHNSPILVDKYIVGKECEIDGICDGENVLIPGIMEHIERAGVHSGDSISVYPAPTISQKVKDQIVKYTIEIGKGFKFIGLFNIQFIVDENENVYVLEVNPRSSRTVPLLSKITDIPMSEIATKCVVGQTLKDQGYSEGICPEPNRYFVKTPVFSFGKLRSVDTTLGPEMKSTGEALGSDITLEKALYKALVASGVKIPMEGNILVTVADKDKERALKLSKSFSELGYGIYATAGTCKFLRDNGVSVLEAAKVSEDGENNVLDIIRTGKVNYVINSMSDGRSVSQDGFLIRRVAAENNISCFTSLDTCEAILGVIEAQSFSTIAMDEL